MAEHPIEHPTHRAIGRPMLIGHRGAPGYRPEHTRSSYLLAFEQGVDAVEPDLVVSSDGVLVIRHENEISGTTDVADRPEFADRCTTKTVDGVPLTGWFVEDFTWAELQSLRCRERVPELRPANTRFDGLEPMLSLRELLALIDEANAAAGIEAGAARGRAIGAVIELKHVHFLQQQRQDLVELLLADLSAVGWDRRADQLTVECFELTPLERLRDAGLAARFVFLLESEGSPADGLALLGEEARSFEWYRGDEGLDSLAGRVHGISVAKRDLLQVSAAGPADEGPAGGRPIVANDLVQRAHARDLEVFTWTLRPENCFLAPEFRRGSEPGDRGDWKAEWRLILSTGLDGVFLDHPDLLAEISEGFGPA